MEACVLRSQGTEGACPLKLAPEKSKPGCSSSKSHQFWEHVAERQCPRSTNWCSVLESFQHELFVDLLLGEHVQLTMTCRFWRCPWHAEAKPVHLSVYVLEDKQTKLVRPKRRKGQRAWTAKVFLLPPMPCDMRSNAADPFGTPDPHAFQSSFLFPLCIR